MTSFDLQMIESTEKDIFGKKNPKICIFQCFFLPKKFLAKNYFKKCVSDQTPIRNHRVPNGGLGSRSYASRSTKNLAI